MRAEVAAWLRTRQAEIAARHGVRTKRTVNEAIETWLDGQIRPSRAPSTIHAYEDAARLHLGALQVVDLRPHHLQTLFVGRLRAGVGRGAL